MAATAGWFTPMLHAMDLARSIRFYETLGFELIDTDRCEPLGWARLHCQGGAVMLLRAEHPPEIDKQGVMFYMYADDLPPYRQRLVDAGLEPTEIQYPDHGPSGEIYLRDPDGYFIGVAHWGEKEHSEWLKRIGRTSI
ncbi:VOC family protein [Pseudogemmatithrix spongiicola]|uniref:VOC family protein n=1 Tax=Pseudogemmatithrix spongiicola TaxID=3062599 RepID=A0AA49JY01_9BACT|nr:VOC family protein [Gemmatimonadaceae bacterium 'strain 138']WKW13877.1 VOC family protein [Gemmatimonadaceae bacterium 'strain 318']